MTWVDVSCRSYRIRCQMGQFVSRIRARGMKRGFRSFPGALLLLIAAWLGIYPARSEQTKPTDEEVERAIRVCSVGTKTDAAVEGGLNVLKRRILTGEGEFSYSEIPSVIGRGVQTDAAKINLFERIQKCVVERVYGTAPPEGRKAVPATPPMRNPKTQPENPRAKEEVLLWQSALPIIIDMSTNYIYKNFRLAV